MTVIGFKPLKRPNVAGGRGVNDSESTFGDVVAETSSWTWIHKAKIKMFRLCSIGFHGRIKIKIYL